MRQLREALIGKHNAKNASKKDQELYLVNPYNEYYDYLHDKYIEYEFCQVGVFLIDEDIIKKMIKTVGKTNRISSHIDIYPLTGFDKKLLSKFENDLQDTYDINDGILDAYGLVKIDIDDFLNGSTRYISGFSIKEALIGKNNIKNASSGVIWIEPSSLKDLVPGRAVKFVDDWNKVRDMIALPSETDLKKNGFLSDVILCPVKTESGYFYHYIDDFMYDGELHRSSGKIIKISKELIDVSKIHNIKDVIQLFKIYGLNSEYRSLMNNESLIGKHNIDSAESHLNYKSYIVWPFGVNFAKVENDGKFFITIRLNSFRKIFVYEEKYLKNIIKQLSYDNIEIYGTDIPLNQINDIIEKYELSDILDFKDYPEVFHQLDLRKLRHEL